jgi:hypothetical protein
MLARDQLRLVGQPDHAGEELPGDRPIQQALAIPSVDTSNPATSGHRKTGHHDDGLRLVIGLA